MNLSVGSKNLFPHQVAAVEWMMEREEDSAMRGGLLCDEMGLGKTLSVMGLLVNKPVLKTLVLAPLSVVSQWEAIAREAGFAVNLVKNGKWERVCGKALQRQLYITNYDKLVCKFSLFKDMTFHRLVCDEAHILRNPDTRKTKRLKRVKVNAKWFLTGTPIVNTRRDIATLFGLLANNLGKFKSLSEDRSLELMSKYALARSTLQLKEMLADVLPSAPVIHKHVIPFETEEESNFYRGIQGKIKGQLASLFASERMDMQAFLTLLLRLRQISVHPQVYIGARKKRFGRLYTREDWTADSTKMSKILDIFHGEAEAPHGYIVFCNFQEEINLLAERFRADSSVRKVFTYDGTMSAEQRTECVREIEASVKAADETDDKGHTVVLAQIQCASMGLNLQCLDRAIFTTPWWTAALMDQAAGRVLRLGQKKQVHIHYISLEAEEDDGLINIDELMNAKVEEKRTMCHAVLAAARDFLSTEDMNDVPEGEAVADDMDESAEEDEPQNIGASQ